MCFFATADGYAYLMCDCGSPLCASIEAAPSTMDAEGFDEFPQDNPARLEIEVAEDMPILCFYLQPAVFPPSSWKRRLQRVWRALIGKRDYWDELVVRPEVARNFGQWLIDWADKANDERT